MSSTAFPTVRRLLALATTSLVALSAAAAAAGVAGAQGAKAQVGEQSEAIGAEPVGAGGEEREMSAAFAGAPWFRPGYPYSENFPDPAIHVEGGTFYAYGTATGGVYLPVTTSTDLRNWTARPAYQPDPYPDPVVDPDFNDALVSLPSWAHLMDLGHPHVRTEVWAPGVARVGDRMVAYLTVQDEPASAGRPTRHCIAVAVADDPLGPFEAVPGNRPLVCDTDPAGSIDADPFIDADGRMYLLWKSEGIPGEEPPRIWIRQLDASGVRFAPDSVPVFLMMPSLWWEGGVVESPSMTRVGDTYVLFYSANRWNRRDYATGVAVCESPYGPCTPQPWPALMSRGKLLGPGGGDVFFGPDGGMRFAYHAWRDPYVGYPDPAECLSTGTCASRGQRRMYTTSVTLDGQGRFGLGPATDHTTGYTVEDFDSLRWAADHFGVDPEYLQRFGVHAISFLLPLSGRHVAREPIEPPEVDGPVVLTSHWEPADRAVLDWVADHYRLTPEEAQMAGAALMVFFAGLDVAAS